MARVPGARVAHRATRSCRCASCACAAWSARARCAALLVTGMYSTFFLGTLYLEHVLHYDALHTGLAFLPWTVTVGILSLGITARLVARFGAMRVLVRGLVTVIVGLGLLLDRRARTRASSRRSSSPTSRSASGIGSSFMPLLTIAMADVPAADAGLGLGDHQRLPAGRRSARPRRARHDRHQPLEGARGPRARRSPARWSAATTSRS